MGDGQRVQHLEVVDLAALPQRVCESVKHAGQSIPAQRECRGESWQDATLYFCNGCAREHEAATHHATVRIGERQRG